MFESQESAMQAPRRYRRFGLALLTAALAAPVLSGCNKQAPAGFVMPTPVVTVADVKTSDVPVYLDEIGKTVATVVVTVIPQVTGTIIKGPPDTFVDGSDVHKDQVLFVIDPRPFQAQVASAEAALEQNNAQLDLARKNFDRIVALMPSKAVAQTDYDTAKSAVDVSIANVKASQAALDTANINLQYTTIKSPIDGRAGQRLMDVGNVVTANIGPVVGSNLLVIQKIDPIYVDFTVTETDLPKVRENMDRALKDANQANRFLAVEVENPDGSGKPVMGKLTFLDNAVQDGTGTIKLRATVENPARILWPGQFVRVRLILQVLHGAMLVPNEAIQIGQKGPYVFTVKPDMTADQRPVTIGQRQGKDVIVETGIQPGDRVVTTGQLMLMDKAPVKIVPSAPPTTQPAATQPDASPTTQEALAK